MNRKTFLATALLLPVLSLGLVAQILPSACPTIGDDGFASVPCCTPAMPTIPQFPTVQTSGVYGCIADCQLEREFQARVRFDWQPALCDYAIIQMTVTPTSVAGPAMGGLLYAKYARTFTEFDPLTGQASQVWRYLINGDMRYSVTSVSGIPCPIPAEAANGRPVHFYGSIDYICAPTTVNGYRVRYDLSHLPECISHAPWSTRPQPIIAGARSRSYHLVGPAPFTFTPAAPPQGFAPGESVRSTRVSWSSFAYFCLGEQRMQGQITSQNQLCPCVPATPALSRRYTDQSFLGRVTCGGSTVSYTSVPIPGVTGGGALSLNLGSYGNGTRLNVYWSVFNYTDQCVQDGPFHVMTGSGTTTAGFYRFFNTQSPAGALLTSAIDMGNSLVLDTYPPSLGFGSPYVSTLVFNWSL